MEIVRVGRYRARFASSQSEVLSAQALRYQCFNLLNKADLDIDDFDTICQHVLIENLETKARQAKETEQGVDEVINRIEALETSVEYINKTIDETILLKINNLESIKSDMSGMKADIESVKTDIKIFKEENKNPLAG